MIVMPYGNLNVNNSGTIKGITVTESADLSNSSKIIYSTFDSGILFPDSVSVPGEGSGSGFVGEVTLDALISSKPALEP